MELLVIAVAGGRLMTVTYEVLRAKETGSLHALTLAGDEGLGRGLAISRQYAAIPSGRR
jgi:hypothetical protein